MKFEKYICPKCKEKKGVRILYGYPSQETLQAWHRKEVELGGCIVRDENTLYKCMKCRHQW